MWIKPALKVTGLPGGVYVANAYLSRSLSELSVVGGVVAMVPKRWTSTVSLAVTPPANRPRTFRYARVMSKLLKWLTESFSW